MFKGDHSNYVIIVAGGKGLRMGKDIPKQFLLLNKKPILMHTISAFYNYAHDFKIMVVLPKEHFSYWNELCDAFKFKIPHSVIKGGKERFFSVKNALDLLPMSNHSVVLIHDGVRPLVSSSLIDASLQVATKKMSSVPVIPLTDSIRMYINTEHTISEDRSKFCLVQTPQAFNLKAIKEAYEKGYSTNFTDDASVFEANKKEIFHVDGEKDNIKITTPIDLQLAEFILKRRSDNE